MPLPTALRRRLALPLLVSFFFVAGCASVQTDLAHARAGEADFARLEALEAELPLMLLAPGNSASERLDRDRKSLGALRSTAPLNASYRARLASLAGEFALVSGDRSTAARELAVAASAQPREESVYLLRGRLETEPRRRELILREGMRSAAASKLLEAELGGALAAQGRYREAVAAFDEALASLSGNWQDYYARERGAALARLGAEGASPALGELLGKPAISLADLAAIAQGTTSLLDFLTGGTSWAPALLFQRLEAGAFFGPDLPVSDPNLGAEPATRARAAYFLWKLIIAKTGDSRLADLYSARYAARNDPSVAPSPSPVPDVPTDVWYFDAVLGSVEREVLALPDGRRFLPDAPISGSEFARAARTADDQD